MGHDLRGEVLQWCGLTCLSDSAEEDAGKEGQWHHTGTVDEEQHCTQTEGKREGEREREKEGERDSNEVLVGELDSHRR